MHAHSENWFDGRERWSLRGRGVEMALRSGSAVWRLSSGARAHLAVVETSFRGAAHDFRGAKTSFRSLATDFRAAKTNFRGAIRPSVARKIASGRRKRPSDR